MNNILIPKNKHNSMEFKTDLTKFLDNHRIDNYLELESPYNEIMETYIYIDTQEILEILNHVENITLSFRIPGATRGGISLKLVGYESDTSHYKIIDIEFIESTCFDIFKVYSKNVVEESKKEFINTNFNIIIQ